MTLKRAMKRAARKRPVRDLKKSDQPEAPNADLKDNAVLILTQPGRGNPKEGYLGVPSDVRTALNLFNLKTATFLISSAATGPFNPQTKALLHAINRACSRRLPMHRPIQISGYDPREDILTPEFVAYPYTDNGELRTRPLPVKMIDGMSSLFDHNRPLKISLKTGTKRGELPPFGTLIWVGFRNAKESHIHAYKMPLIVEDPSVVVTDIYLNPDRDLFSDPETEDVEIDGLSDGTVHEMLAAEENLKKGLRESLEKQDASGN